MAKKKKSVLAKQRPKKSRKKAGFFRDNLRLLLIGSAAAVILGGTIFFLISPKHHAIAGKNQDWKLTVRAEDKSLLEGVEEKAIIEAVKQHVGNGSRAELLKAVGSVKAMETFAKVHLVRTGENTLTLYYAKRVPVMCYRADKDTWLVSDQAEIYGSASGSGCPGPLLSGVIEDKKNRSSRYGVMQLVPEEQKQIEAAINLLSVLRKHGHQPSSLTYEKYRGFYINLEGLETDIALGNPPFDTKLEKLGEVLEKIKSKGEVAQRIELDFQGKAFIKLKKS
jgi:hypothetical protein